MDITEVATEGWALKKTARRVKYTAQMEDFLNSEYVNYVKSGRKRYDPYHIQQKMRKSRKPMFTAEQRLSASKINSYFNSRKKKLEALAGKEISNDEEARARAETNAEFEQNLQNGNFAAITNEEEQIDTLNRVLKHAKTTVGSDTITFDSEDWEENESEMDEEDVESDSAFYD